MAIAIQLIMEMRTGREAGRADIADDLPAIDALAGAQMKTAYARSLFEASADRML